MGAHSFDDDYGYDAYDDYYYEDEPKPRLSTLGFSAIIISFIVVLTAIVAWTLYDNGQSTTGSSTSQSSTGRGANSVHQGDVLADKADCLVGATDSTKAWVSAICAVPGTRVATEETVIGIAGEMTDNGLIPVALNEGVSPKNMYEHVSVSPYDDNLKGVEVCSMGASSTIYGCGKVISSQDGVGRLQGLADAPAGAPVWIRSTLSDDDPKAAQMVGVISVPGSDDKEAVVSFIPLDVSA